MKRNATVWALCAAMTSTSAYGLLAGSAQADTSDLDYETVLTDLEDPWDMAFLSDGTMFFTEKCRGLSVRLPSGDVNRLLGMTGTDDFATTEDDLFCEGQAGMNGVAVDPDFDSNRYVYVYSSSSLTEPGSNRVIRLAVNDDLTDVSDRTDIVEDIPYKPEASDHPFGGPGAHNGGRIRFNPGDGYLYVTTGDTHNGEVPQSPTLLGGKVLRIDRDGNAAEDNAPPEGFDARIYTYGHRNVQGIAFRPDDHRAVITEHGPWHTDEINVLQNGGNSGWDPRPNMAGRDDCPDDYCGYSPNQMEGMEPAERAAWMPMTDYETYPDAMVPAWENNQLSQGIAGAAYLSGDHWGEWEDKLVVGYMGIGFGGTPPGQRIDVMDIAEDGASAEATEFPLPMEPGRFRSLVMGPDNSLYVAIDEGDIYRITPN